MRSWASTPVCPRAPGSTLNFGGTPYPYYLSRDAVFQNDLFGDRKRPAANVALQWKPNGLLKGFGIQASATSLSSHQDIPGCPLARRMFRG
jgi:hypothetical protein